MSEIGYFALCLALVAAGHAVVASVVGAGVSTPLSSAAAKTPRYWSGPPDPGGGCLWFSLLTHDFRVQFVAENSNLAMPTFYVIAALWGGQSGSLLFWGWLLSLYGLAVVLVYRRRFAN